MTSNGTKPTLGARIDKLEQELAEQAQKTKTLTTIIAALVAQQMQPQLQQHIADSLNGTPVQ